MKNSMTAVIDVDATVDEAYAHWQRSNDSPPGRLKVSESESESRVHWVVRVNGVQDDSAPSPNGWDDSGRLSTWASPDVSGPTGEVAFDPLEGGQTRVTISLEWQRPDWQESPIPLIFLDGVQVDADLRSFKRELEGQQTESPDWRQILRRFEAL